MLNLHVLHLHVASERVRRFYPVQYFSMRLAVRSRSSVGRMPGYEPGGRKIETCRDR